MAEITPFSPGASRVEDTSGTHLVDDGTPYSSSGDFDMTILAKFLIESGAEQRASAREARSTSNSMIATFGKIKADEQSAKGDSALFHSLLKFGTDMGAAVATTVGGAYAMRASSSIGSAGDAVSTHIGGVQAMWNGGSAALTASGGVINGAAQAEAAGFDSHITRTDTYAEQQRSFAEDQSGFIQQAVKQVDDAIQIAQDFIKMKQQANKDAMG